MRRKRVLCLVWVSFLTACSGRDAGAPAASALRAGDVWIRGATLVSPERSSPLLQAHVVIRGERILSVGPAAPTPVSDITVVEGAGRYLVPGLIDGHVHLANLPGMTAAQAASMPDLVAAYFEQLPRSYLYFGFTTLVDLNIVDRERVEQVRDADLAPAVFDCGNALPMANGYMMVNFPPAERFARYPNFLYDSRQADAIPEEILPEDHTPEAAVGRVVVGGGRCVKSIYETGFGARAGQLPVPTVELMRQVREASHRQGLPLLLHANSLEAHRFAVEAGVDAVVHGLWMSGGQPLAAGEELPADVREVLDAERRDGIAYMPTSRVLSGLADLFAPAFLDDPRLAKVVPPAVLAWYRTDDARGLARLIAANFVGLSTEEIYAAYGSVRERTRATAYVARTGGRLVFGSDTPSDLTYGNPPGLNGYLELRELEAAGVSARQLLAAATLEASRLFGLESDYGTVTPGRIASLLLLRDDPLASTAAFDAIETVIVRGRVVPREALAVSQP